MAGQKDIVFTLVIPNLKKKDAYKLRTTLISLKQKYAPKSKASIAIGKRNNYQATVTKCDKQISTGDSKS